MVPLVTNGDSWNQRDPVVANRQPANAAELTGVAKAGDAREDDGDDQRYDDHPDRVHKHRSERCRTLRDCMQNFVAGGCRHKPDEQSEHESGCYCKMEHLATPIHLLCLL